MVELEDSDGKKEEWPWDWRRNEKPTDEMRLEIIKHFPEYARRASYAGEDVASEGFLAYCEVAKNHFNDAASKGLPSLKEELSDIAREATRVVSLFRSWVGVQRYGDTVCDDPYYDCMKPCSIDQLDTLWNAILERLNICMDMGGERGEDEPSAGGTNSRLKRKRPTQTDMENRNRAVAMAAGEISRDHDRLPTVSEIVEKTKLTRNQIYATDPYKEGKIAKRTAKAAGEMIGGSVQRSEFYGGKSEEHGRGRRRSESEQAELDVLLEEHKEDVKEDERQDRVRKKRNADDA